MRCRIVDALAAVAVVLLDRMFPSVPPPLAAEVAREQAAARELERHKSLTWCAKIRAADREMEFGDADFDEWMLENGWIEQ